jgi:DNA-binding XRE family transcriptional regulator
MIRRVIAVALLALIAAIACEKPPEPPPPSPTPPRTGPLGQMIDGRSPVAGNEAQGAEKRSRTQTKLATRARVSPGYVARLETLRHDPKLSTLVKLAKALDVPEADLLE